MNLELNKTIDKKSLAFKRAYHNKYYAEKLKDNPPHFCTTCKKNIHFMGIARHNKTKYHIKHLDPDFYKKEKEFKQNKKIKLIAKINHYKDLIKAIEE